MTETLAEDREDRTAPARSSAHRRRSTATHEQKLVVAIIVVVGTLVAVVADTAPTGYGLIDFLYRAGFVALLVLMGSRARRWSLITASALAAGASLGVFLLAALVALVVCALLVVMNRRDRVWGAAIGLFVSIACFGMDVGLFLGSSGLVGALAASILVTSGYRNSRAANRRTIRWIALGLGGLWVLGVVVSAVVAATAFGPLTSAVEEATDAASALQGGQTDDAVAKLERAAEGFESAQDVAAAWWATPGRLVPVLSQHMNALHDLSSAGVSLSQSAAEVGNDVDYDQLQLPTGGIDLERLQAFAGPILQAESSLDLASETVERVSSPWLLSPIAEEIDEFRERLVSLRSDAGLAAAAVRSAPAMLGKGTPRRYLILLGNPAESRDLGGHIGNWAEILAVDGRLELVDVGLPLELAQLGVPDASLGPLQVPESLLSLQPGRFPQNWGGHLDFPTDARLAGALFERATGRPVDGVVYADPFVVSSMLALTGPVSIPGNSVRPERVIDSQNAVRFLTFDQYIEFPPSTGDQVVTELVRTIFDTFVSSQLPGPQMLGERFGPNVREGRLRFTTVHDGDDELLERLGLNFGLPRADDSALFVGVVHSNANPSKIDSFLTRRTAVSTEWDPTTGDLFTTVRITITNGAPASGLPDYVIGNGEGLPLGTNSIQLAVLSNSKELESASVDGEPAPSASLDDIDGYRHQMRVDLGPGETKVVEFVIVEGVEPGETLQIFFAGQPTLNPGAVEIRVIAPGFEFADGLGIERLSGEVSASVPSDEHSRVSLRVVER